MGALEAPLDRHGQEHRTGTSRAEQTDRDHGGAGSSGSHGGAGSSGGHGRSSSGPWPRTPRPGPYSRNPFTPQKNFHGAARGYQKPFGARHRQTGQPTGTGSPPGRARKLRLLLGMTRHQGPSQGSLSYLFHFHDTGGRRLGMASSAMTRGAACPRRVSVDKTRQESLKCSCGHDKTNTALLAVTCGLDPRDRLSGGPAA